MIVADELKRDTTPDLCNVLIVDDDEDALEEYCECAATLGYGCFAATDAYSAIKKIAEDTSIGIVITDLKMPNFDGLSLLDELDSRFLVNRHIVSIVITGHGSIDAVIEAMRYNARDFLQKPVTRERLAAALRRATRTWNQVAHSIHPGTSPGAVRPAGDLLQDRDGPERLSQDLTDQELLSKAKTLVRNREARGDFLDRKLFSDPSWDILLDLTSAKLEGIAVPVASACAATHMPFSTALRYLNSLVERGLVRRWKDPTDRRRDLLELEDNAMDAMCRYLKSVR